MISRGTSARAGKYELERTAEHTVGSESAGLSTFPTHNFQFEFKETMCRLVGNVGIVATGYGDARRGLTVTSFCSVSCDPPTILVCINQLADAHNAFLDHASFSLNILDEAQTEIAGVFAGQNDIRGVAKFDLSQWEEGACHAPLLKTALFSFVCYTKNIHIANTHSIIIAEVARISSYKKGNVLLHSERKYSRSSKLSRL